MGHATQIVTLALVVTACGASSRNEELGASKQRFASHDAVLLDFAFDGQLFADTDDASAQRRLIEAQLMFSVGQLNGERSVGRHERLELSEIVASQAASGRYRVTYHAKLPVAWGAAEIPTTYELVLPRNVAPLDQVRFTQKYGTKCVDPEGGDLNAGDAVDAGRMFLFYRPHRDGCVLDPEDVVKTTATVSTSAENSTGKYPEYHRIWEDRALDVLAVFGSELDGEHTFDAGVEAFDTFVGRSISYLRSLQPDETQRTTLPEVVDGRRRARIEASLPDGRAVHIDTMLVGPRLAEEKNPFDDWYEAGTPNADLVLYSGHAAHGANVRTLMSKGSFRKGKYLIWVSNGCDTFAYLDGTLAKRRAELNPDDPSGTKHMDTVSNVLGGWFHTGDETSMRFIQEIVSAGDAKASPKTYPQIFEGIDRDQVIVVTGEEDNVFPMTTPPSSDVEAPAAPPSANDDRASAARSTEDGGCAVGARHGKASGAIGVLIALAAAALRRRGRHAS